MRAHTHIFLFACIVTPGTLATVVRPIQSYDFIVCCRAVSELVEELLHSDRYNSRTRPASDLGLYFCIWCSCL